MSKDLVTAIQDAFTTPRETRLSSRRTNEAAVNDKSLVSVDKVAPAPILNAMVMGSWQFMGIDGKVYRISLQQKKFCEAYVHECRGIGVDAYFAAGYKSKNARSAASAASALLTLRNISAYVTSILPREGYNDENVQNQHLSLINQEEDKRTKAKAIDMYFKLKGKYPASDEGKGGGIGAIGAFSLSELADRVREARQRGIHTEPPVKVDYIPLE